jgi:hypothetical protein
MVQANCYLVVNTQNGRAYLGQAGLSISQAVSVLFEELAASKKGHAALFSDDYKKYGRSAFEVVAIEANAQAYRKGLSFEYNRPYDTSGCKRGLDKLRERQQSRSSFKDKLSKRIGAS